MTDYIVLKNLARSYLQARNAFLTASKEYSELGGNDNIMGRIGEMIAIGYLRSEGRAITKNINPVAKGYDLLCGEGGKISVKIISGENKSGQTSKISHPWTELIVIKLNSNYQVEAIGHILLADFKRAVAEGCCKRENPVCSLAMLKANGLFRKYGIIKDGVEVAHYL